MESLKIIIAIILGYNMIMNFSSHPPPPPSRPIMELTTNPNPLKICHTSHHDAHYPIQSFHSIFAPGILLEDVSYHLCLLLSPLLVRQSNNWHLRLARCCITSRGENQRQTGRNRTRLLLTHYWKPPERRSRASSHAHCAKWKIATDYAFAN